MEKGKKCDLKFLKGTYYGQFTFVRGLDTVVSAVCVNNQPNANISLLFLQFLLLRSNLFHQVVLDSALCWRHCREKLGREAIFNKRQYSIIFCCYVTLASGVVTVLAFLQFWSYWKPKLTQHSAVALKLKKLSAAREIQPKPEEYQKYQQSFMYKRTWWEMVKSRLIDQEE